MPVLSGSTGKCCEENYRSTCIAQGYTVQSITIPVQWVYLNRVLN